MSGSGEGGPPEDVQAEALDAVGYLAHTLQVEAQYEEPPVPPETIAPDVPTDSYLAQATAQFQAGEPPPSDPAIGGFVVEEVDTAELQQPVATPQVDMDMEQ